MNAIARPATVAIAIVSWIAISNHCLFAAVARCGTGFQPVSDHRQDADATACPFHSKPAKRQTPNSTTQCCKILRAVATVAVKIPPRAIVDLPHVDLAVAPLIVGAPAKISLVSSTLDTGPPGTTSFAELIGSMRAHAPPLFA